MNRIRYLARILACIVLTSSIACTGWHEPSEISKGSANPTTRPAESAPTDEPNTENPSNSDFPDSSLTAEHAAVAKELQGTWTVVSFHRDGSSTPVIEGRIIPYTFQGNKLITIGPLNAKVEIEYRLSPAKEPKQIDQRFTGGSIGPWIAKGIYELDGDFLTICYGGPKAERPSEFTTRPRDGRNMRVHKRIK